MRIPGWIVLLGLAALLVLAGCSDSSNKSTLSGALTSSTTRSGAGGETVTLSANGNTTGITTTTDANGGFSFRNISDGTYVLQATGPDIVPTMYGPVQVAGGTVSGVNITVFPVAAPPAGATTPINGTATAVIFGVDNTNTPLAAFTAQVGSLPVATGTAAAPAIVTNIAPGTYPVTVTNTATGLSSTITVLLTANTVNAITIVVPNPNATGTSVTGTATTVGGTGVSGATATLLQNGVAVGTPVTTAANGSYSFSGVAPGTYALMVAGASGITTTSGPVVVTAGNVTTSNTVVPTVSELPTGVAVPTNGTATVAASGFGAGGSTVTPVTLQVGTTGPFTSPIGQPAVLANVPPGTYTITVTNANNLVQTLTFANTVLAANKVYIVRAILPGA